MGYAGGVGKVAAVIGPILAGTLLEADLAGGLVASGYLLALTPLAVAFALGGLVVLAFGRETRGEPLF
jgi:putative MFS transporter